MLFPQGWDQLLPPPPVTPKVDQDDNGVNFCPGIFPREEPRSSDKVQDARGRKLAKARLAWGQTEGRGGKWGEEDSKDAIPSEHRSVGEQVTESRHPGYLGSREEPTHGCSSSVSGLPAHVGPGHSLAWPIWDPLVDYLIQGWQIPWRPLWVNAPPKDRQPIIFSMVGSSPADNEQVPTPMAEREV